MKYRKLPVVIEAFKFTGHEKNYAFISEWSNGGVYIRGTELSPENRELETYTLEGSMRGIVGDYVIRGVKGEYYFCKPDIFKLTYEVVNDDN